MDSLREYCVAEATNPLHARDAGVAGRQKMSAFVPRKLTLCRTNAHSTVKAVGLAVLGPGYRSNIVKCDFEGVRSFSRPQEGSESPIQCVLYSTEMTPPWATDE